MLRWLAALCFLFALGCTPPPKKPAASETQQWLLHFTRAYRKAWAEAPDDFTRSMVNRDYHRRLIAFITGKAYLLDSVRVTAGHPQAKGSLLFTEFKGPGIVFHDEIESSEEIPAASERWRAGRDTVLSFKCLGPVELSDATEAYPLRIEATPLR